MSDHYDSLNRALLEAGTLGSILGLLSWDQETMMPPRAASFRASQLSLVGRLTHERFTAPRVGELLERCESDRELVEDPIRGAFLREIRRDYDRATRLPAQLVGELHETGSRATEAWREARRTGNFRLLEPWLDRQMELHRRKADCYGTPEGGEPYDSLLQDFEPEMTAAKIEGIFGPLRAALTPLLDRVRGSRRRPDVSIHRQKFPLAAQQAFSAFVIERLGFDPEAGRLDVSSHPFSSGIAPGDTRLTSRYHDDRFADALGSTMHEAGHALYEQGLPKDRSFGSPEAEAVSLAIHESQSRLWENHVGRSFQFWEWALPAAAQRLGSSLRRATVEGIFRAVNVIEPHPIRVESDELTYNFHIMLRFDLERAMLSGELPVAELPAAWNARMHEDLGLRITDDTEGCLQDIHWPMGSIGYFPTYSLGNLYAARFWEAAERAIPDLNQRISQGRFGELRGWLRDEIHAHGRRFTAAELCQRVSGGPLDSAALVAHLSRKVETVYVD